ncbi:serine hydrolase domain-containing protein [Maribacter sp. IgM3_T14_3]|uniref:serine hydrolase domain-containing protein n=1 Tax=Maribacter sp. IgM3_T14_3 TaxID=3415140 RepID=UPI003C6F5E11
MKKRTFTLIIFLLTCIPIYCQLSKQEEKKLDSLMQISKIPGVSLSIIKNNKLVYNKGFGISGGSKKVTEKTIFQAASLSKFPTALLFLINNQNQQFDIDNEINLYLKTNKLEGLKSDPSTIPTISQLLSHTGGINMSGFLGYKPDKKRIPTIENVIEGKHTFIWEPKIKIKNEVNSENKYSGGGYCYLQKAIKDTKGEPFRTVIQKELLQPLNMQNSFYSLTPNNRNDVAYGYSKKGKPIKLGYKVYPQEAAAALWTTSFDYSQLLLEVMAGLNDNRPSILTKESIKLLTTPTNTTNGKLNLYGLGVGLQVDENGKVKGIGHSGANIGYSSFFYLDINDGSGYVLLTNRNFADLSEIKSLLRKNIFGK